MLIKSNVIVGNWVNPTLPKMDMNRGRMKVMKKTMMPAPTLQTTAG